MNPKIVAQTPGNAIFATLNKISESVPESLKKIAKAASASVLAVGLVAGPANANSENTTPVSASPATFLENFQPANPSVYTDKITGGYHQDKQTSFYNGTLQNLLEYGDYTLSTHAQFPNPVGGGQLVNVAINVNSLDPLQADKVDDPYSKTQGAYWAERDPAETAFIKMDDNMSEAQKRIDEVSKNILIDFNKGIIPASVASSEDEINQALAVFAKTEFAYTLMHEFSHTLLMSLSEVDLNNIAELDAHLKDISFYGGNGNLVSQIKESVADVSSIIYLHNHGIIQGDEVELLIKGLILPRVENTVWFEENLDWTTSSGDVGHNTVPALLALLELYKNDTNAFMDVDDKDIITVSENIIWELIKSGNPFLDDSELKNNIANDNTIQHLKNVYKTEVASLKTQNPSGESKSEAFITDKAREHQNEFLKQYYITAQKIAQDAMNGFDVDAGNQGTKYYTLRDINGNNLTTAEQETVMNLFHLKQMEDSALSQNKTPQVYEVSATGVVAPAGQQQPS